MPYQAACARITLAFDGFLADFRGDGILAYFGYPRAHEDDAERTVRAALDIAAAVARLKTPAEEPLSVRIGIATGLVVVGDRGGEGALREHTVVGDSPSLAARLQGLAEPGTVVIAASTRRLLGDLFRLRDLGQHKVKGIAEPIAAWAVDGVSASESRFEAIHAAGLTNLIGREDELDFLLERQRLAWKGEGQIVLISGEPGIGKSRLVAALEERIAESRTHSCNTNVHLTILTARFIRSSPNWNGRRASRRTIRPSSALTSWKQISPYPHHAFRRSPRFLPRCCRSRLSDRYPKLPLNPAQQRRRTFAALLDQFEKSRTSEADPSLVRRCTLG